MIAFLEGKVAEKRPGELVLLTGGVGFLVQCSNNTLADAPSSEETWRIYTVMNVREDAIELFGFSTTRERDLFKRLCTVTGVGAKTALGILSSMPLRQLSIAIATGDVTSLSKAQGVGKKTAQRIVLELKDKMSENDFEGETVAVRPAAVPSSSARQEAQAALQSLGYTAAEAARAVDAVPADYTASDQIITQALRRIGSL